MDESRTYTFAFEGSWSLPPSPEWAAWGFALLVILLVGIQLYLHSRVRDVVRSILRSREGG